MANSIKSSEPYRKMFKSIYPEKEIRIINCQVSPENKALITASFPDGRFYFIVTPNTISPSFDTLEEVEEYRNH